MQKNQGVASCTEIADFVIVESKNVLRVNTNERVMSSTNLGLFWSYSGPARSYCALIIVTSRYSFISISFITAIATSTQGTEFSPFLPRNLIVSFPPPI